MIINFNVGLLGHVDSGKTSLARALSSISSTAAFDKNPQSKERGITLDLGFSAARVTAPSRLKQIVPSAEELQITFVDCPGHASLIRTIIGGAQIINLMILVIDGKKGIQTQTAECIVIGEILNCRLIVVVNKIDLFADSEREIELNKLHKRLRKALALTRFGTEFPIYNVSAEQKINVQELLDGICSNAEYNKHDTIDPLLIYVDHCFSIKGQGSICTGTILQGTVSVGDTIEIPSIKEQRKIKSMQMFHKPVNNACIGDRVGLCLTQFNSQLLERGVLCQPGYLKPIFAACIPFNRISYYKFPIKSKSKIHVSIGHDTIMTTITLFKAVNKSLTRFELQEEYEYVEALECTDSSEALFALLQFESAVLANHNSKIIASKLDLDSHANNCRLAFWGDIQWRTYSANYVSEDLIKFKVFKRKEKQGCIQRFIDERQIIVQNLFKKEANRDIYVGKEVQLSTGENGFIDSTFGQSSKVKVCFRENLKPDTLTLLKKGKLSDIKVTLKFKKYIFNKTKDVYQ